MGVGKLKNGKAAGKDEVTGKMIKGGDDIAVNWIWRLCNMTFESGVVPEDWRSAMIVPLYKGKGEMTECKIYKGLLSVVGKIYAGVLANRVRRATEGLFDNEQGVFRSEIFTLKQIEEKTREKKQGCMRVLWIWRRRMIWGIRRPYGTY